VKQTSALFLAVVLAGVAAYAVSTGATLGPARQAFDMWFVAVDEESGNVVLAREDFDAIVRAFNQQRAEILQLRLNKGCP
jgi:hypothetical protein